MESIINDLKSALDKLNEKIKSAEKRAFEFSEKSKKYDSLLSSLGDREKVVSIKEEKYKAFDNVESARASINAARALIAKEKESVSKDKQALDKQKESMDNERKALDEQKTLFRKKNEACDKSLAQLEQERKSLEKKIIEQFTKNITKG